MRIFRAVFRILQPVWPAGAAWLAERLFFTAPRRKASLAGRAALAGARRFTLSVAGRRVVGWRWGSAKAPVVYLAHGWGSRGSRLAAFTAPLVAAGYSVVTYDAPGHGASGWGMSSMPDFARTLMAVVAREEGGGGQVPHAVIAHSFGCAGTALAMSWGLEIERLVFLAPAADPPAWLHPFVGELGLTPETVRLLRDRSERRLRVRWNELNVCDMARRFARPAPLLIVHDKSDETVGADDGVAIAAAWPGSRLIMTDGLGHRGVTHDKDVVRQAVEFVTADLVPHTPAAPRSDSWRVEQELFYREERL